MARRDCLEELGVADVSHELVIEQLRPDGPIRPTTALAETWWDECLRAPGADHRVRCLARRLAAALESEGELGWINADPD